MSCSQMCSFAYCNAHPALVYGHVYRFQTDWHINLFCLCSTFHRLCFFLYLLKMVFLTLALAIAARPELTDDQLNKYPQPLDYFRGICEVLLLIFITINIIVEILEFTQWVDCIAWDMYRQVIA